MTQERIAIGSVVRDSLRREGIVLSKEKPPARDWIEEQVDAEDIMKLGRDVEWWGVMPFTGGYLLCPEPMLTWLRSATYEDFLVAADHAGIEGRASLAKTFPHYVDEVLASRQKRQVH